MCPGHSADDTASLRRARLYMHMSELESAPGIGPAHIGWQTPPVGRALAWDRKNHDHGWQETMSAVHLPLSPSLADSHHGPSLLAT